MEYIYRVYAIEKMFQEDIYEYQVEEMIGHSEVIKRYYIYDKPYPSF